VIGPRWQISAGELFELLRPAAWALSILLSACVLADTQRRQRPLYAMAAWTIGTLFLPLVILPIYIIARFALYTRAVPTQAGPTSNKHNSDGPTQTQPTEVGPTEVKRFEFGPTEIGPAAPELSEPEPTRPGPSRAWKILLPLLYTLTALSLVALFFLHDYRSVDAHLARANQARLLNQRERTIREYRAALSLEDDAHTHNLLAEELAGAGLWEDALAEMRAAAQGGEPDETIPYRMAYLLDLLNRRQEATPEYQNFLHTHLCTQSLPDPRCENARLRLQAKQ
jgi:tetratricopeptide (TPR) repeat protein